MAGSKNVTMNDVARHAAVSRTTVSFVLNGEDESIPEHTRARVLASAAQLGYRPNAGARALASSRTRLYGLVTEIVTAPFAADIIKGAQAQAAADNKTILIASAQEDPDVERAAIETMLEHRIEGLLYATVWNREVSLPPIASEVPTVLVHCFDAQGNMPSVIPDEFAGGYAATKRLTDAGHRRIGFISLDPGIRASIGRREGYERALRDAGIEPRGAWVVAGDGTADGGYDGAGHLLAGPEALTAIFCGTDRMAMGVYDAARERGLRIPHDLSVIGFDNQELISNYLRPKLTTAALPFEQMGAQAISILSEVIAGKGGGDMQQVVPCALVERNSVAAPPRATRHQQ